MWPLCSWLLPLISSTVWVAMLLAFLVVWFVSHRPVYQWQASSRHAPFISDIGATDLKPLFAVVCVVTASTFFVALCWSAWLRHRGFRQGVGQDMVDVGETVDVNEAHYPRKTTPNTPPVQSSTARAYAIGSLLAAAIGSFGLIFLPFWDTWHHNRIHQAFLGVFVVGHLLSSGLACMEFMYLRMIRMEALAGQSMDMDVATPIYEKRLISIDDLGSSYFILRWSIHIKLIFFIFGTALATAFAATLYTKHGTVAAILEWIIAFLFAGYMGSCSGDGAEIWWEGGMGEGEEDRLSVGRRGVGLSVGDDEGIDMACGDRY